MPRLIIKISILLIAAILLSARLTGSLIKIDNPAVVLMPIPAEIEFGEGRFYLDDTFTVSLENGSTKRLAAAATRILRRLSDRTGIFFSQDYVRAGDISGVAGLSISCQREGSLSVGEDESYTLSVSGDHIVITAITDLGAMHGLETLLQLLSTDTKGYYFPSVIIMDRPRYTWRGLLIDSCRHFLPADVIKRNLDGMSAVKMNVLHWHLSEDQGFRVECKTYPKLHEAGSDGLYYTQEQIREVIRYAADRGIRVVPEFDIPGHATSWLVAYPELASGAVPDSVERRWGVFDPVFNPTIEDTYRFFDAFFKEMAALFKDDYIHIGGDENNGVQWSKNPQIQQFMKDNGIADNHALQAYFNKRISGILKKYGKKMIGWDEIFQPDLPGDIVIQSWRGKEFLEETAKKGYRGILSSGYYIDLMQSADFHYLNDPLPSDTSLDDEQQKLILGGEATMWTELVSPENIDSRIWPRTAAIAERLWSPGEINDVEDMYHRLTVISCRLEEHGLNHIKNQEMMLRRLTGYMDISSLKTLMDVIEPLKFYNRHNQSVDYTSHSPLTRIVDAALPDSSVAGRFSELVDRLMKDTESSATANEIRTMLIKWKGNHRNLKPIIENSPVLREIDTLSENLSKAGDIGFEALSMYLSGRIASDCWMKEKLDILNKAAVPVAETEVMIIPAIAKLVEAASGRIDLTGEWLFRQVGNGKWLKGTVPGTVHTDLLNAKFILDPFYGTIEKEIQWIENEDWEYTREFFVNKKLLESDFIDIHFKGLDTYTKVFLNDKLMINADNMFREWKISCKDLLIEGENRLRIVFESPIKRGKKIGEGFEYELPEEPRVFTRKAAYHYGWDWGPRFVTSGIWKPVYIKGWSRAKIDDIQIIQEELTDSRAEMAAIFEIQSEIDQRIEISILDSMSNKDLTVERAKLKKGSNKIKVNFDIRNPKLWWANAIGKPHLYTMKGRISNDENIMDEVKFRFGIRTLELIQERDEKGRTFYFKLNGLPIFIKGANYIPQDSFLTRVSADKYRRLVKTAVDSNMNMLRVWGGGVYEDDLFYDLCDENGIFVWQDFMFACAMYPGSDTFLANVREEAIRNIKRLRNHPSLALWCGNNEIDEGWHNWGWQKKFGYTEEQAEKIWNDYRRLFLDLLPSLVRKYDPERPYYASSPLFGWGDSRSLAEGDSHYWGVWWGKEPFEIYRERIGRFMSEYGFQSLPGIDTIKSFCEEKDLKIDSELMKSHQKHPTGYELIDDYMQRYYKIPEDFDSYIYISQLLQAEGIKMAIEAHRRAVPYCMGTLYWQLNDCWQSVSWSSTDYYGRWKALQYFVKNAYKDLIVSFSEKGDQLEIYLVSDRLIDSYLKIRLRLIDFDGEILWEKIVSESIGAATSRSVLNLKISDLVSDHDKSRILLVADILNGDRVEFRNLHYFVYPKDLKLSKPLIQKEINEIKGGYALTVSSDKLVKNLYIDIPGINCFLSDNFFDLLPGEPKRIEIKTSKKIQNSDKINLFSMIDAE